LFDKHYPLRSNLRGTNIGFA